MATVDQAAITQFKLTFEHAVQQKNSKVSAFTTMDQHQGKRKRYTIQQTLSYAARTGRLQTTTNVEPDVLFRWLNTSAYDLSPTWDRDDEFLLAEMQNPNSPTQMEMQTAYSRLVDDTIITSLGSAVQTGEDGTTNTAFPAGNVVAVDYVDSGVAANSNFPLQKMTRINEIFNEADVDPGLEKYAVIGPKQVSALQRLPEYQSMDTNAKRGLMTGQPTPFLGLTFILSNRLPVASDVRTCYAFCKPGIVFNPGVRDMEYTERSDKRYDRQLYSYARLGAMRLHDPMVVQFLCDESVA